MIADNDPCEARIASVCRDVPVPAGLRQQILGALAAAEHPEAAPLARRASAASAGPDRSPTRGVPAARRLWTRRAVVAAACVGLAAAGIWLVQLTRRPTMSLSELIAQALGEQIALDALPEHGSPYPPLPATMDTRSLAAPRQLGAVGALYSFQFRAPNGRLVQGRLVAAPARWVSGLPSAMSFSSATAMYHEPYCYAAWVEGDMAYVCLVRGGENNLRLLRPLPAVTT